jgi:hypothetical protein
MRFRFVAIAAAAGLGVLFAGPGITSATPLMPIGSSTVTTAAEQPSAVEQVRWGGGWGRGGWGHRCWNCGYRHGYGAPFYFSFGFPYYGGYGYPYYGGGYGYPYYGGYGYPYYGGYGYGGYYGAGRYYRHGHYYRQGRYYGHRHRRHW